jgi:ferredoxin
MAKQVVIDEDECVGCESCVDLCPDVFGFDQDTEKANVIKPKGGDDTCIQEAIDTCPTECISWENE